MRLVLSDCDAWLLSPDRPQSAKKRKNALFQAAKYGITPTWFKAIPNVNKRISACQSIVQMCQQALLHDKPFLFLEDDITSWNPATAFDLPDDVDIFRIGITTYHIQKHSTDEIADEQPEWHSVSRQIIRTYGMLCTHALIFVTRRAKQAFLDCAQKIIQGTYNAYDTELAAFYSHTLNDYALKWPTFYQDYVHSGYPHMWEKTKVSLDAGILRNLAPPDLPLLDDQDSALRVRDAVTDETVPRYETITIVKPAPKPNHTAAAIIGMGALVGLGALVKAKKPMTADASHMGVAAALVLLVLAFGANKKKRDIEETVTHKIGKRDGLLGPFVYDPLPNAIVHMQLDHPTAQGESLDASNVRQGLMSLCDHLYHKGGFVVIHQDGCPIVNTTMYAKLIHTAGCLNKNILVAFQGEWNKSPRFSLIASKPGMPWIQMLAQQRNEIRSWDDLFVRIRNLLNNELFLAVPAAQLQ